MILINGGSGYIGSHIVRRLAERREPVRVLVRDRSRFEREGRLEGLPVEIVFGDVTEPASLFNAMGGVHTVVHTVAIAIESGERTYEAVNFEGTVNMVNAAQATGVRRFINLSQLGADSSLPYRFLASKGRAQEVVAGSDMQWTAFRPSVIWGPEDEFANTFARLIPFSPFIFPIVGDQSARFQPIWVEDVVTCIEKALSDPNTHGREYELGGPEILTLEMIERRTLAAVGAKRAMVRFPMPLLRVIVILMERILPAPPVTSSLLELLAVSNVADQNAIGRFVEHPRPFTPENTAPYMVQFRARSTISQFLGRS